MDSFDDERPPPSSFESLRDPKGIVRRRWRPMLIVLLAGLAATPLAVWLLPPIYTARASVLIATQKLSENLVKPTIQEDATERINALTSEVLSRQSLTEVIEKFDLYPSVRREDGIGEAIAVLGQKVSIEMDPGIRRDPMERARVVLVYFSDDDAQRSADVTNDLAQRLTQAGLQLRKQQARVTTEFLRREQTDAEAALEVQSKKVSEFEQQHRGELPSELEANLRRLERLQQQRNSLALQIAEGETRIATLSAQERVAASPQSHLVELKAALARELAVNTETHPNVISLRRQIELTQKELGGSTNSGGATSADRRSVTEAARHELDQLRVQLADTDKELTELDAQVARTPAVQQELDGLVRRETVLRDSSVEFMHKVKDAELAESLETAQQGDRVSILDPASPPPTAKRAHWQVALGGVAAALAMALGLGLFLEWRDPLLLTAEALESMAGVPVLGSLPHIPIET
jgi:uncharacterized protein involved in exopolysaccharide biosynthesis